MKKIIIAIDGYSSCGKSTFAKKIAAKLGYTFIDTGAMYRAVTLYALRNGIITDGKVNDRLLEEAMDRITIEFIRTGDGRNEVALNGEIVENEIRSIAVSNAVSAVSQNPLVRKLLVRLQQRMGDQKGVVMDGRDIGTVVFPNAELKIFMMASPEVRARRRFLEMQAKGDPVSLDDIMRNIQQRDHQDETRQISPLKKADDAIILDNSSMSVEQQMDWVLGKINALCNEN